MHQSVLLVEAVEGLAVAPGRTVVDATVGAGGHAERILETSAPDGRLVGFDRDARAVAAATERLRRFGDRAVLLNEDFKNIAANLQSLRINRVEGIFADLGVSSPQLDEPDRGFSFMAEGPLDMRMDTRQALTAAEIVNRYPPPALVEILRKWGQERFAGRIARRIVEERSGRRIRTTRQLVEVIRRAVPVSYRHGRIHPATRTFQALRIAVNSELESLEIFLKEALPFLGQGGRFVVTSFHSLEDRIVKNGFRRWQKEGLGRALTRRPIRAGEREVSFNPRARSAKMRVFEKGNFR